MLGGERDCFGLGCVCQWWWYWTRDSEGLIWQGQSEGFIVDGVDGRVQSRVSR